MMEEVFTTVLKNTLAPPPPPVPELLTRKQAAQLLGQSLTTIDQWTLKGKLRKHRIAGAVRFKRSEIMALLQPA